MKRSYYIIYLLLIPLFLSSCDSDGEGNGLIVDGDQISFIAGMPGVSSRTTYDVLEEIYAEGITISAFPTEAPDGPLATHFEGGIVKRDVDGAFRSKDCRWPVYHDRRDGHLKFFAFHPSCAEMRKRAGVGTQYFRFANATKKDASGIAYDYRLTRFRVAPDISKQVDFVTSQGEGNKTAHLYSGVELDFEHQLCGVEISAWGASTLYDVEVAGVRIGGTVVEADFNLSTVVADPEGDDNTIGSWIFPNSPIRGYVDFVFAEGDKIVNINASEHNTKAQAASIMGSGGKAMLIPYTHSKWDYANDRKNNAKGMYFSALIRMTEHEGDHHRIFPSTDPTSQDYIVYLSVLKSDGTVMKRLDKNGNEYGSNKQYTVPSTEEVRHYGWAAVPANVAWKAGYTYSYILDYTKGVGVHDPVDPNPAIAIIDWVEGIEVVTPGTESQWGDGETIGYGGWGANSNNTGPDGTVWWK